MENIKNYHDIRVNIYRRFHKYHKKDVRKIIRTGVFFPFDIASMYPSYVYFFE